IGLIDDELQMNFWQGVVKFIEFACAQENYKKEGKLRCQGAPLYEGATPFMEVVWLEEEFPLNHFTPLNNLSHLPRLDIHNPSPHSQTKSKPVISQPLQSSPTSAPSPHSQTGPSIDLSLGPSPSSHENPHNDTLSLTLENIRWGSKDVVGWIWIMPAPGNK
ncbi:hypothetical protein A2U01_0005053, partial [Trifolium medium]|nr:hypothetical protein [Trifolium medium]